MDLIMYTLRSISYIIVEPSLIMVLVILGVMFYLKNRKIVAMQRMIIGEKVNSPLELTLSQIVLGIIAGIIASLILSHLGVIFKANSGIEFLFILSIILMFFKPRLVCFSYSGAILGVVSLIFTYFNIKTSNGQQILNIDIAMLMTFVGVMHIVEALLVIFDGWKGAIPVFSNKKGKIVGGYALSRNWVLPISIFIAMAASSDGFGVTHSIGTPSWWPILNHGSTVSAIGAMILTLMPLFGVLGYSSLTFTRRKKEKALSSGVFILSYGIILTLVAQLANLGLIGKIFVIAFAPLAHELMLKLQNLIEEKREALFISGEDGTSVLDVVPYSKAYEMGLRAGDKIVTVNGKHINTEGDIYPILKENLNQISIKFMDKAGRMKECTVKHDSATRLGCVLVPRIVDMGKVVSFENKNFSEVLKDVKKKEDK